MCTQRPVALENWSTGTETKRPLLPTSPSTSFSRSPFFFFSIPYYTSPSLRLDILGYGISFRLDLPGWWKETHCYRFAGAPGFLAATPARRVCPSSECQPLRSPKSYAEQAQASISLRLSLSSKRDLLYWRLSISISHVSSYTMSSREAQPLREDHACDLMFTYVFSSWNVVHSVVIVIVKTSY